jgi:hypothetical protein
VLDPRGVIQLLYHGLDLLRRRRTRAVKVSAHAQRTIEAERERSAHGNLVHVVNKELYGPVLVALDEQEHLVLDRVEQVVFACVRSHGRERMKGPHNQSTRRITAYTRTRMSVPMRSKA